jgi:hypothetical protein
MRRAFPRVRAGGTLPLRNGHGASRYALPHAPLSDYLALAAHLGLERFVFVAAERLWARQCLHARCHAHGRSVRCRGIVDVDVNVPDAVLSEMDRSACVVCASMSHR